MKHTLSRAVIASILVGALGACSLGVGGKAPRFLLTLNPASSVAANDGQTVQSGQTIVVSAPLVPQAIATARIPVADGQNAIAYVKDTAWVEPPARLFQRLLSETIRAKTGRVVLDPRHMSGDPGALLSGQLLHFGMDAPKSEAVVIYDATIARDRGKRLETRRFEVRVPVGVIDGASSGSALNRAANDVAAQVASWVGR